MIERVLVLLAVAIGVGIIWGVVRIWQQQAISRMQSTSPFATLVPAGTPAVIAFSSPTCTECRTRQAPALSRLERDLGQSVTVIRLSAPDHPQLVEQAGILTVPATVVLDRTGAVRHLNLGFADTARLVAQVGV